MNHAEIKEKMLSLHDCELNVQEKKELEVHLQACQECRDFLQSWEKVRLPLGQIKKPEPSESFVGSVMSQIESLETPALVEIKRWSLPDWLFPALGYGVAAVIMLVIVNQPVQASPSTESVLLSSFPSSEQWVFLEELNPSAPLINMEEELL